MPDAGLHLDIATKTAGLWSIEPLKGLDEAWPELWPGWHLEFWEDDFRQQVARCRGLLDDLPVVDIEPELRSLAERVRTWWPVWSIWRDRGVDVDMLYARNIAGLRSQFDVNLTADELVAIADMIARGSAKD